MPGRNPERNHARFPAMPGGTGGYGPGPRLFELADIECGYDRGVCVRGWVTSTRTHGVSSPPPSFGDHSKLRPEGVVVSMLTSLALGRAPH